MEKSQTVKIQYLDPLETYTAHIQRNGSGWSGWIPEVPGVKCEEDTRKELLKSLEHKLYAVLEAEWEAWCERFEENVNAGKLDRLGDKALEDLRVGRCIDLFSVIGKETKSS